MGIQKYKNGDYVHAVKHSGFIHHPFTEDNNAIVIASYDELYGPVSDGDHRYSIHIEGEGEVSWYYEEELELIENNRLDLLKKWKDQEDQDPDKRIFKYPL